MAVAPLLLASLARLLSLPIMPWRMSSWPHPIVQAVLLGILLVGVAIAARKGFPLWSHSWIVLTIITVSSLFTALSFILLEGQIDFGFGWFALLQLFSLLAVLLVLAFAVSQAGKGLRFTFFVVAVYLISTTVGFPFIGIGVSNAASTTLALIASDLLVIAKVFLLILMVAMVMNFVTGNSKVQRQSLWVLIVLFLVAPIFHTWLFAFNALDAGLLNVSYIIGYSLLMPGIFAGVMFLIAWRLAILVAYLDERHNRNDHLQGANNAS